MLFFHWTAVWMRMVIYLVQSFPYTAIVTDIATKAASPATELHSNHPLHLHLLETSPESCPILMHEAF
jgi:hypothetical protein